MATYSSILDWRIPKDKRSLAGLTMLKPFTVWITTNYGKFLKEIEIPDHLTCLLRKLYAGQEATLRTRHGQWTSSKLGKEYIKSVCCHPAYLTYMQSTSCEMPGWMNHKLESRNINSLRYADDTTLMAESKEELKSLLMKVRGE